ncbi:hypothetical protein BDW68DRAFT_159046 [Aspergillus falconensis]
MRESRDFRGIRRQRWPDKPGSLAMVGVASFPIGVRRNVTISSVWQRWRSLACLLCLNVEKKRKDLLRLIQACIFIDRDH